MIGDSSRVSVRNLDPSATVTLSSTRRSGIRSGRLLASLRSTENQPLMWSFVAGASWNPSPPLSLMTYSASTPTRASRLSTVAEVRCWPGDSRAPEAAGVHSNWPS